MTFDYICSDCGAVYEITPDLMVCPLCEKEQKVDEPLRGVLEVRLKGKAEKDFSVMDLLPVEREFFPPIPVGNTPSGIPVGSRNGSVIPACSSRTTRPIPREVSKTGPAILWRRSPRNSD